MSSLRRAFGRLSSLARGCRAGLDVERGALVSTAIGSQAVDSDRPRCGLSFATVPLMRNRRKTGGGRTGRQQEALPAKNDEIRGVNELRVVFPEGKETKIMALQDAKNAARELNLDLVMASTQSDPPVARIISWEKMLYAMRQKQKAQERAAREHRKLSSPKEVRIGCHIAPHDLETKLAVARKILCDNHQVLKLSVTFKGGREIEAGKKVLDDVLESLGDVGKIKDPKHVQKPQTNRWAVQLEPMC
jgi:translation initiation factor IF-3